MKAKIWLSRTILSEEIYKSSRWFSIINGLNSNTNSRIIYRKSKITSKSKNPQRKFEIFTKKAKKSNEILWNFKNIQKILQKTVNLAQNPLKK